MHTCSKTVMIGDTKVSSYLERNLRVNLYECLSTIAANQPGKLPKIKSTKLGNLTTCQAATLQKYSNYDNVVKVHILIERPRFRRTSAAAGEEEAAVAPSTVSVRADRSEDTSSVTECHWPSSRSLRLKFREGY